MRDVQTVIAQMGVDHYRLAAEFEREQKMAIAKVLEEIILLVDFEPGPPYDEPLFLGSYSMPRLLEHIRGRLDR